MSRHLFIVAGILGACAFASALGAIWTIDVRWWDTCGAFATTWGAAVFAGVMLKTAEG